MAEAAQFVRYDDGNDANIYALVESGNDDGTLNLITFPSTSPVEHVSHVPEGLGGRTWHTA